MPRPIRSIILIIFIFAIAVFLLIQLIPYGRNHDNPPVVSEPNWDSSQTRGLAKRACFDCHSNETVWPWYSNIAPASWLTYHDAIEARKEFNFSDWQAAPLKEGDEILEVIGKGEMPPLQYLFFHASARLSSAEKGMLIDGLMNTIAR